MGAIRVVSHYHNAMEEKYSKPSFLYNVQFSLLYLMENTHQYKRIRELVSTNSTYALANLFQYT